MPPPDLDGKSNVANWLMCGRRKWRSVSRAPHHRICESSGLPALRRKNHRGHCASVFTSSLLHVNGERHRCYLIVGIVLWTAKTRVSQNPNPSHTEGFGTRAGCRNLLSERSVWR